MKGSRSEARLGLIVPGPLLPGRQPTSRMGFLSAKAASGPLPHLCPTSPSCKPVPWSPAGWLSHTALLSAGSGLRTCSSLPWRPSWAFHQPPATRPHGPPLWSRWLRLWQALGPEAPLLTDYTAAGGLESQSERFIVVFRGRLGADVIMSVNSLCKL